jgi:PmbA protein
VPDAIDGIDLVDLARSIADQAKPGEQVEAYVARGVETDVRAYDGHVESLSQASSAGVGIRVVVGGRQGFASAGSLDAAVVAETLAEARDNVRFATPDDHVGLAVPDGVTPADLDLWDDSVVSTPAERKIELALQLERRVRAGDGRIRQVSSADYGDLAMESAVASSTGIVAAGRRTSCSLAVSAVAGEDSDSHTGVGVSAGRGLGDLDSEWAAVDAVTRATRLLGATKGQSTRCTVVLDPRVTATLLGVIAAALSGESATKNRSMFVDRVGEQVAGAAVSLVDDPTDPRAFTAGVFDAEGLACRRNKLVTDGVLRGFVHDSVSARRAGTASTGSAVRGGYATTPMAGCRAVCLAPGTLSADQVLAAVGDGLYVQSVTGVHSGVSPVSGDFSVGAEGVWIRGGAMADAVREVTVASTVQRMLQAIVYIGADLQWLPGTAAGQTLAIADMAVSGD